MKTRRKRPTGTRIVHGGVLSVEVYGYGALSADREGLVVGSQDPAPI
jgi:hypothetical protein